MYTSFVECLCWPWSSPREWADVTAPCQ